METLGSIDLYVLDQIMKGRYDPDQIILDAGCGSGRNMHWFYHNGYQLMAVDQDPEQIEYVKSIYPDQADLFQVASLSHLPYPDNSVDHIINCAVLHFSESTEVFKASFAELVRVLKPQGSLLIRMTSDIGVENQVTYLQDGVYELGDDSERFLLSRKLLQELLLEFPVAFLEPLKSTNVADLRSMSTLVLTKY
jgi:SAM-dependent methyltransferase